MTKNIKKKRIKTNDDIKISDNSLTESERNHVKIEKKKSARSSSKSKERRYASPNKSPKRTSRSTANLATLANTKSPTTQQGQVKIPTFNFKSPLISLDHPKQINLNDSFCSLKNIEPSPDVQLEKLRKRIRDDKLMKSGKTVEVENKFVVTKHASLNTVSKKIDFDDKILLGFLEKFMRNARKG